MQYFNFSNDVDNGYEVSTQEPFILTRHSDGKKFVVGPGDKHDGISPSSGSVENESSTKPLYDEKTVGSDLARFGEAVGDVELDVNCCKR